MSTCIGVTVHEYKHWCDCTWVHALVWLYMSTSIGVTVHGYMHWCDCTWVHASVWL